MKAEQRAIFLFVALVFGSWLPPEPGEGCRRAAAAGGRCGSAQLHFPGRRAPTNVEVGVLEQAGLVTTEKIGRVRTCKLGLRGLEEEAAWIERYRQLWDARFDDLDKIVEELKRKEKVDGRKKRELSPIP